jgi:pyridoxamine 5'-phosphate oxidase
MPANEFLPEPLPPEPMSLVGAWFTDAARARAQPNPDAMTLATADAGGMPSARIVLCKHLAVDAGYVVFYTNYRSRKARELMDRPRAAGVLHWDQLHRQVRIEGPVVRSPVAESDTYFNQRPLESRIGAWASEQSEPLASRAALAEQVRATAARFGVAPDAMDAEIPRPPHWGGHRLWIDTVELWVEGPGRIHDRAIWRRDLEPKDQFSFATGPWSGTRLNP